MASGSTVKIDGIGTFYYTVATNKNGVATPEEVTSGQINGVRVRFIPEVKRSSGKQITTRSMVDADVVWMDIEKLANGGTSGGGSSNPGGSGSEGGEEQDPLG